MQTIKNNKSAKNAKKIIAFLVSLLFFSFTNLQIATAKNSTNSSNISAREILELVNTERAKNNIPSLKINNKLIQAANNKANYLVKNNYFSHSSRDGKSFSTWIKKTTYKYSFVGENLAKDFPSSKLIVAAWLKSPGHKENLLNENFTETGIAVNNNIVVQIFGRPETIPLSLKTTINKQLSENLILYNRSNKSIISSRINHLV